MATNRSARTNRHSVRQTGQEVSGFEAHARPMTTTSPTQTSADIRIVFARAMATATDVIANVRPDQLDGPTPCGEYDVRR